MKKLVTYALSLSLALSLTACGGGAAPSQAPETTAPAAESAPAETPAAEAVELHVYAAASLTESMNQIAENYKAVAPNVTITYTFDSSGTLKTQIQEGADCDVFISAGQKQMNQMDITAASDVNTEGLDLIDHDTRFDILENKVTLVVPEGNPKNIQSFDDLASHLQAGDILMVMGNSDVPVGQYTQKILAYYNLDEEALASAGTITYATNVKEVTSQVSAGSADCGVIYQTDAYSAGLAVVDSATKDMCGRVVYPAAATKAAPNPEGARAFLDFLKGDEATADFSEVGFTPLANA